MISKMKQLNKKLKKARKLNKELREIAMKQSDRIREIEKKHKEEIQGIDEDHQQELAEEYSRGHADGEENVDVDSILENIEPDRDESRD